MARLRRPRRRWSVVSCDARRPSASRTAGSVAPLPASAAPSTPARPSLTENTSAKSAATCISTTADTGSPPVLRTSICSCHTEPEAAPTNDQQPRFGRRRRLRATDERGAAAQSASVTANDSTVAPPTSRRAWLSTRMSAKNTPWVGLLLKSPERPLRQNVCPSTSVIMLVGSPRLVGSWRQHPRTGLHSAHEDGALDPPLPGPRTAGDPS